MKIKIKKASLKDANFFYELRNEKTARKNFFNTNNIKYNDHLKWYKKKLRQKNTIFLIALINNSKKIGMIRYDFGLVFANISIIITQEFRNHGHGSKIIKKSEKFLKKKTIVISQIKKKNKASVKIFRNNNYEVINKNNNLILMKII